MPINWGVLGLVYDSKALPTAGTSYKMLFTLAMKGKVHGRRRPSGCAARFVGDANVVPTEQPFKAEVTSEGQAVLLPLGSEIGLHWDPSACVLLDREEER